MCACNGADTAGVKGHRTLGGQPMLVFAGNARQADDWARYEAGLPRDAWRYVGSADALRGYNTGEVPRVFIGTFYGRHDAVRIEQMLRISDMVPYDGRRRPT